MPTPAAETATVDLTASGNAGNVNGAAFTTGLLQPAGTGNFDSFLQIQNAGIEQGYNTDARPQQFNEGASANHNHSLLLASVPIVEGDGTNGTNEGTLYREFLLDLNEPIGGSKNFLSLDELQIWQEEAGSLTGFTSDAGFAGTHTNHLAYDLDAGGNHWVALTSNISHGSGESDFRVLIPDSFFINDTAHRYVYLYSLFGQQSGDWVSAGGFEEWGLHGASGGPTSALNIQKSASVPGGTADTVGELISYTITLSNTGSLSLTGITVTDPFVSNLTRGLDTVGNNDTILNVGEVWSYTADHAVTQADIDSSGNTGITNTVSAGSDQTGHDPAQLDTASATVAVDARPAVTLDKAFSITSTDEAVGTTTVDAAGDVIHYTIAVTNDGNTTLTGVVVTDSTINIVTPVLDQNAPIVNPNVELFTPVTDGDGNLGDNNNNGIDEPTDHNGVKDLGETWQFVYPGDTNSDGRHDPGETWVAFNLGDTNNDGDNEGGVETFVGDTNDNGVEDNGETWQFKNIGDTNNNNLQDGGETWQYSNAGDDNRDGVEDPGETYQYANVGDTNQNGAQDSGETFQFYNAGDTNQDGDDEGETWQFTVNNSPDPVSTISPPFNDGDENQDGKLNVGETWEYAYDYTVTQDDIDNRMGGVPTVQPGLSRDNTASVDTDQNATSNETVSIPIVQDPAYSIVKSVTDVGGDGASGHVDEADDMISYQIEVSNDGNMTLTGISLDDELLTGPNATLSAAIESLSSNGELDVGETWTYTGTYTAQQSDINDDGGGDGDIDNTATVHSDQLADESSSTETLIDRNPAYSIVKTVTDVGGDGLAGHVNWAGDVISYQIVLSNDGNVDLTGTSIIDALLTGPNGTLGAPSGDIADFGTLNVGEIWTFLGAYTAQQADIDDNGGGDGFIDNTATVQSDELADQSSSTMTPIDRVIGLELVKTGTWMDDGDGFAEEGEFINYVFHVTNTGNVTQTDVQVGDLDGAVTVSGALIGSIAPGVTNSSATGIYEILQFDVDEGYYDNTGVANSFFSNATDDEHVILPQPSPEQLAISNCSGIF